MKKVITTVGTSIFTNLIRKNKIIENLYNSLNDKSYSDWDNQSSQENITKLKDAVYKELQNNYKNASAEIKSILKIKDIENDDLEVHFLCTDSILSPLSADILIEFFEKNSKLFNKSITGIFKPNYVIEGLQVKDRKIFEKKGLPNLINQFQKIINENGYENCILNITGGYKALIPYLTIAGQIHNVPICYIFENTDELIKFPQAPICIDWGLFEKYSSLFEELYKGTNESLSNLKKKYNLEEDFKWSLIKWGLYEDEIDGKPFRGLNAIGDMFWNIFKLWQIVYVVPGVVSKLPEYHKEIFKDKVNNLRNQLEKFIQENNLNEKTTKEIKNILANTKRDILNHANVDKEVFIYKQHDTQIRILYDFEYNNGLKKLTILDIRIGGNYKHEEYIDEFKKFYKANKNIQTVPYLQLKED